jgi:hypothetical protein
MTNAIPYGEVADLLSAAPGRQSGDYR